MRRIGIDTGGTFTDFIISDGGRLQVYKVLSTPHNPAEAVLEGLARWNEGRKPCEVVHGTTVATNALLERKGARTALITTAGFEDVLEIGRQNRPELYNLLASRPAPLVPAAWRFGVPERIRHTGRVATPLDITAVKALAGALRQLDIESVAVCFLFSFVNPRHEKAVKKLLADGRYYISLSHEILPEFREYERTSTTVVNAYLSPVMAGYLGHIVRGLRPAGARPFPRAPVGLRVMQSNGGSISATRAMVESVRTILSGPAAGVVGAVEVARRAGFDRIITFDMGGTSTDVCLCPGRINTTAESIIANCPVGVPVIDIHTVGAGGGSFARIDAGGALKVGPESAGADPGPICYGRGGRQITVTDAHLMLGRIDAEHILGGAMAIHAESLAEVFDGLANGLRIPAKAGRASTAARLRAAQGVIDVANANMEKAIRLTSIERGYDPRDFTLVTFGGAGGLHACDLARALRIPRVLVPENPGLLSALGALLSDVMRDYSQTVMLAGREAEYGRLEPRFEPLIRTGSRALRREGFAAKDITFERLVDMRYAGQAYELSIPFRSSLLRDFHAAHERRYGYSDPQRATEIVTLRVRFTGHTVKPSLTRQPKARRSDPSPAQWRVKPVYFNGKAHATPFYQRERLRPGWKIPGPAVVVEYSATTCVPPDFTATVDGWRNLILTLKAVR